MKNTAFQIYSSNLHVVLVFQIVGIPALIGLLFELSFIFSKLVAVDESQVFLLCQDWALGLIFSKIWTRLVSNCSLSDIPYKL